MIRLARRGDVAAIEALVRELAEYEQAAGNVEFMEGDLETALFGEHPKVFAHVAEHEGEVVGMAVWYVTYSTWTGRHGIYLEDLFVRPNVRGLGLGRALLSALARTAVAAGYTRLEWAVLDWNEPAIGFYRHLRSEAMGDWTIHRVSGEALRQLARPSPTGDGAGLEAPQPKQLLIQAPPVAPDTPSSTGTQTKCPRIRPRAHHSTAR